MYTTTYIQILYYIIFLFRFNKKEKLTPKVFPEPVWATPTIFLPLIAIGQPCA